MSPALLLTAEAEPLRRPGSSSPPTRANWALVTESLPVPLSAPDT